MAFPKRKVVYTLISLLLAAIAVLAVGTWRARTRFRAIITIVGSTSPPKAAQRHIADLIFIAQTREVMDEAVESLTWEKLHTPEEQRAAFDALYTLRVRQVGKTNRFTMEVTAKDEAQAKMAVEALARALIRRYGELVEGRGPAVRIAGEPKTFRIHRLISVFYLAALCRPFG